MTLASNMAILGRDIESDSSLLTRILNKMQRPPNGGNGTDYRTWAQDATDANGNPVSSAQIFAYVYPNYYGVGSPLVVVLVAGTGTGRQASAPLIPAFATMGGAPSPTEIRSLIFFTEYSSGTLGPGKRRFSISRIRVSR
jgi:hypothetical protein